MTSERTVSLQRTAKTHYTATNAAGDTIEFGQGEGLFSPVELLLAAIGGCSAIDVDLVTSRRGEPDEFTVTVSANKVADELGSHLTDIAVDFTVKYPDTDKGRQAEELVPRLVAQSRDKDCTVSRTVSLGTDVAMNPSLPPKN